MRPARATGLAGQAIAYAEKTQEAGRPLLRLKQELDKLGEDFADCSDQCDVVARMLDQASEAMLQLARQILARDKARADQPAATPHPQDEGYSQKGGDVQSKR